MRALVSQAKCAGYWSCYFRRDDLNGYVKPVRTSGVHPMAPAPWLTHACPTAQRAGLWLSGLQPRWAEYQALDQSMKIVTAA